MKMILITLTLVLMQPTLSLGDPQPTPTPQPKASQERMSFSDFMNICKTNLSRLRHSGLPAGSDAQLLAQKNLAVGDTDFVGLETLVVGQGYISFDNVLFKRKQRLDDGDFTIGATITFNHNHGNSIAKHSDPIEVVKTKLGLLIVDGHHDYILSLSLGAKTIPVKVVGDYSNLEPLELWKTLRKENLIYLARTDQELADTPPHLEEMVNVPNRYLAGLLALKVLSDPKVKTFSVHKHDSKTALPVWIKLDNDIPFIEFAIAKALFSAGIEYHHSMGESLTDDFVENVRIALFQAVKNAPADSPLRHLRLLSKEDAVRYRAQPVPYLMSRLATRIRCQDLF